MISITIRQTLMCITSQPMEDSMTNKAVYLVVDTTNYFILEEGTEAEGEEQPTEEGNDVGEEPEAGAESWRDAWTF